MSPLQERVLVAALDDREEAAREAWADVLEQSSLDELGHTAFELLPLVWRNLRLVEGDEDLPRLRGVYRRTWVKNNVLAQRTKETGTALRDVGIRALFVEGIVLASRFYEDLALRPTSVIDVLVDRRDRDGAPAALARAGWREPPNARTSGDGVRYFFDVNRNVCAVRTTLALDAKSPRDGDGTHLLFRTAQRHDLDDVGVGVPAPTEVLFAVIVEHARSADVSTLQWIADAKMAMRAEIDWRRLAELAESYGQVLRLRDALEVLARLPGGKAPQEIRDELDTSRVSRRERLAYFCSNGSIRGPGRLPDLVGEHVADTADRSALGAVATFPAFLRDRWGLTRRRDVPVAAGTRALRHFGRRSERT
jgi:Uncharacterised nucleotidyltransferase